MKKTLFEKFWLMIKKIFKREKNSLLYPENGSNAIRQNINSFLRKGGELSGSVTSYLNTEVLNRKKDNSSTDKVIHLLRPAQIKEKNKVAFPVINDESEEKLSNCEIAEECGNSKRADRKTSSSDIAGLPYKKRISLVSGALEGGGKELYSFDDELSRRLKMTEREIEILKVEFSKGKPVAERLNNKIQERLSLSIKELDMKKSRWVIDGLGKAEIEEKAREARARIYEKEKNEIEHILLANGKKDRKQGPMSLEELQIHQKGLFSGEGFRKLQLNKLEDLKKTYEGMATILQRPGFDVSRETERVNGIYDRGLNIGNITVNLGGKPEACLSGEVKVTRKADGIHIGLPRNYFKADVKALGHSENFGGKW